MHEFICVREPENVIIPRVGGPCESGPEPTFVSSGLTFFYANIQNFLAKRAELEARLCLMEMQPTFICLNETWLDPSIEEIVLSGYDCVSRLDRRDGRIGGGVAVFALRAHALFVSLSRHSDVDERTWLLLHSDVGPVSLCCWYRPPCAGEIVHQEL